MTMENAAPPNRSGTKENTQQGMQAIARSFILRVVLDIRDGMMACHDESAEGGRRMVGREGFEPSKA
jgi:hypothetical protein